MNSRVRLTWKVVVSSLDSGVDYSDGGDFFTVRTGNTFLSKIGGASYLGFLPRVLEPNVVFYNALRSVLRDNGFKGKKFPLTFNCPATGVVSARVNLNVRCYPGDIVVLSVSLSTFDYVGDARGLKEFQLLESHPSVNNLVKAIACVIVAGSKVTDFSHCQPKIFPVVEVEGDSGVVSIDDDVAAEILTRHLNPRQDIVSKAIGKNIDHQLDVNSFLIDRQGMLVRYAFGFGDIRSSEKKFESAHRLFELGICISVLMERKLFGSLAPGEKESVADLVYNPGIVFLKSVTACKTWVLVVDEFKLKEVGDKVINFSEPSVPAPREKESLFLRCPLFNWVMGIIASIIVLFATIYFTHQYTESQASKKIVGLISPLDGVELNTGLGKVSFLWEKLESQSRSVISLEKQSEGGSFLPLVRSGGRFVTSEDKWFFEPDGVGYYRWKVLAKNSKGLDVGVSDWSYFTLTTSPTPVPEVKHAKKLK